MAVDQAPSRQGIVTTLPPPMAAAPLARLSLQANASWMLVGNGLYAACQWAMLMVLARLGTPTMVGQFVLALAVTTPVMALFWLQLRTVQATDARGQYAFHDYFALRLITTALAIVTVLVICLAGGYWGETALVILVVALSASVDSASDIIYGLLQQHERLDRMAQSMILKGTIALATLSAVLWATGSVVLGVLAIAVSRGLVFGFWDLPNARHVLRAQPSSSQALVRPLNRGDLLRIGRLAQLAFPLGLAMMLIVLGTNIPRYAVEHTLGESALGIFGALAYLGLVGTTAVGALGESATPQLAQCYAEGRHRAFLRLLTRLVAIGAGLGVLGVGVAWLAGPLALELLYGPEYAAQAALLVWTMLAAGISYVAAFTGYAVTAARYFRIQIPLFVAVVAVTAAASLWLVPRCGLVGAAWAMCATALAQLLGRCLILGHALGPAAARRSDPDIPGTEAPLRCESSFES